MDLTEPDPASATCGKSTPETTSPDCVEERHIETVACPTRYGLSRDTVPLSWAALCCDCSAIRDVRLPACPRCSSGVALPLARVLGREAA